MIDGVQEQSEADKARLKTQLDADLEANRQQRERVQAEKAKVDAALEMLEMENKCRAEAIRNAQAAAAKAMAEAAAVEAAKKKDLILQLRHVTPQPADATSCASVVTDVLWGHSGSLPLDLLHRCKLGQHAARLLCLGATRQVAL